MRLFVLSFEDNESWSRYKQYFLPTMKIKDNNVMIDGQNFLDQLIKNDMRKYHNFWKITNSQGDDYTNGCLLYYPYFQKDYNMIAIDLTKQQALRADVKGT